MFPNLFTAFSKKKKKDKKKETKDKSLNGREGEKLFWIRNLLSLITVSPWTMSFSESKVSWGYQDRKFPLSQLEYTTLLV